MGIFDRFSADGDKVTGGLPDGLTDEYIDVWMERSFPRFLCFRKFHTGKLVGIFTMDLADGWMDRTDDGHTDTQTEFHVESCFGWQTDDLGD